MRWAVNAGDILDEPADVLVCSANVFLNLSGGVGGAILLRYGDAMQRELHETLARSASGSPSAAIWSSRRLAGRRTRRSFTPWRWTGFTNRLRRLCGDWSKRA